MNYLSLSKSDFFKDISKKEIEHVLGCLNSEVKSFKKGELMFSVGDDLDQIGLVLSGSVLIESNDLWGNRSILGVFEKNDIFAESYAFINEKLKVDIISNEDTEILFLNAQSIITMCAHACHFHTRLIHNLLSISSTNNIRLSERILSTSPNTIRGKLISYLSQEAKRNESNLFLIPLNRQELSHYLNVNRSALSNELGKMRDEGILNFQKNKFELLNINLEVY